MNYKNIITIEPNKRGGKLCIRAFQITIEDVLENLAAGMSEDEILQKFPSLNEDDIFACLVYGVDGEKVSRQINNLQFDLMMLRTPQERVAISDKMFTATREAILESLPKNLSEREIKKQLYFRTYGEHLPEEFFSKKN